jgi:hypothetical protein
MKNKSTKISLIVSIMIFLLSGILFFFLYQKIEKNIATTKQTQIDLETEMARREDIKNFNSTFKSIMPDKTLLETHFAQSSNVVPFLNTIGQMARSVGTKSEVSAIEIAEDNTGLLVTMKDTGSFSQVYKFITLLENSPYELEFTSVEMSTVPPDSTLKKSVQGNVWQAVLNMKLVSFI